MDIKLNTKERKNILKRILYLEAKVDSDTKNYRTYLTEELSGMYKLVEIAKEQGCWEPKS